MIKYIDLNIGDAEIDHASCFGGKCPLTKVAGENLLDSVKQKKDHAYLHVIAMGAGDFYSQNKNGDFFYEKDLRDYHNTFETAGVFIQHFNKDPSKTIGKVLKSIYNETMHRVELVIEISKKKSPEQYERVKKGERISVSMGVKVPCFHPDTYVLMGSGSKTHKKKIVDIIPGETVVTSEGNTKTVLSTTAVPFVGTAIKMYAATGDPVICTPDHRFHVLNRAEVDTEFTDYGVGVVKNMKKSKTWIMAKDLDINKHLLTRALPGTDDDYVFHIVAILDEKYTGFVHDIEVEDDHSFIANDINVHNSEHCSYCGKVTKGSLANRCDHLKYKMGDTMENGQVAYAINDTPMNFFDISIVAKPADFQGHSLFQKVASMNTEEEYKEKIATLVKHMDAISAMPEIDDDELDDFKETFSPGLRLKIIRSKGIILHPSEALFLGSRMKKEGLPECRRHCNGEGFLRALMDKVKNNGGCKLSKEASSVGDDISSPLLKKLETRTMLVKEAIAGRRNVDFYGNKRVARPVRDTSAAALRKSRYAQYKIQMMNGESVGIPGNMLTAGVSLNPLRMLMGGSKVPAYYTDLVDDGYAENIIGVLASGDEKIVYLPDRKNLR